MILPWRVAKAAVKWGCGQYYAYVQRKDGNKIKAFSISGHTPKEVEDKVKEQLKHRGWT